MVGKKMDKYNEPQVCVINNSEIAEKLQEKYVISEGDLGTLKQISYKPYENQRNVHMEYVIINNLHEYKIVIIDMQNKRAKKWCLENEAPNGSKYMYKVKYPEDEFDSAPVVMNQVAKKMGKDSFRIIFACKPYGIKYKCVEILGQNQEIDYSHFTLNIYDSICAHATIKEGNRIKVNDYILAQTIAKYVVGYNTVFRLPTIWDETKQRSVLDREYIPLILNRDGEVIAYFGYNQETGYELLLPVCKDKEKLIDELFSQALPGMLPDIFPESREFQWINSQEFKPKEILEYDKKKENLEKVYKKQLMEIETQEKEIFEKYQFLNDLLTQTGDELVNAVCKYLEWLGYSDVQKMDGQEEILREDIQICDDSNIFIIEVKGIGGTSTDAECSQIAKHRRKREKENRDKNIIPIYIVNHQRYKKPQLRDNPPFSNNQIDYAESDERGLLTTWQLYQQFHLIEDGIFTKEETRQAMKKIGLITLLPENFCSIGKVVEYYNKPKACILNIQDVEIERGDYIWAKKGDVWKKGKICSLQVNDKDVANAQNGEVGLVLDIELAKGYELFGKTENKNP